MHDANRTKNHSHAGPCQIFQCSLSVVTDVIIFLSVDNGSPPYRSTPCVEGLFLSTLDLTHAT